MNVTGASADNWVDPLIRPVVVASIPASGNTMTVTPDAGERAAIAKALKLASVDTLTATFQLNHRSGSMVSVEGEVKGRVQLLCVTSLEPFPFDIKEMVEMRFAAPGGKAPKPEDVLASDDPPDEILDGVIDLGKITTEFLSLAIPAFPRKPGASGLTAVEEPAESPFAALARLKEQKPE